jgi:hypothetical protein
MIRRMMARSLLISYDVLWVLYGFRQVNCSLDKIAFQICK